MTPGSNPVGDGTRSIRTSRDGLISALSNMTPFRDGQFARYLARAWYFQWRVFPSASHSTVCCTRRSRVSSVFAAVIHTT